jgi:hypothetical protein
LCGNETETLLNVDQKNLESLKCGAGVGWSRSVGPIVLTVISIAYSYAREEYPTDAKKMEGYQDWSHLT